MQVVLFCRKVVMRIGRTFFEQELRKLFGAGDVIRQPVFVGRCCTGYIGRKLCARIEFVCSRYAGNYDALQITVINPNGGLVDKIVLLLADLLETGKIPYDFNFPGGEAPYIWVDGLRAEWYAVKPTEADYAAIRKAVQDYLSVFGKEKCE